MENYLFINYKGCFVLEEKNKDFKLTFYNYELILAIQFLQEMELKPSDSRHRTKLVKELVSLNEELVKEQMELIEIYGERNESDNSLMYNESNGSYIIKVDKKQEYNQENKKLLLEEVVITGGPYIHNIKQMESILANYTGELSGEQANIYDKILDEFEKNNQENI